MKIRIINIIILAVFAVGCIEEQIYIEPTPGKDVSFSANINKIETKTLYGVDSDDASSIKVKWVDGDLVQVYGASCSIKQAEYSIAATSSESNTPNEDNGQTEADSMNKTGSAGVQWGTDDSDFYAVYPSSAIKSFATDGTDAVKVKTSISSTQYNSFSKNSSGVWQGTPFDFSDKTMRMTDAIMYAVTPGVKNGTPVNLIFKPFSTVLKFKINSWVEASDGTTGSLGGKPEGKSVQLKSISITAPYAIAGDFDLSINKSGNASAIINDSYDTANNIVITPAEQVTWTYGEEIEFSVFTIPVAERSLADENWIVVIETTDGSRRFTLKPKAGNTNNKPTLIAGKIHKILVPGFPVKSAWEYNEENWIESIPRNVYLSELSLPGAWYSTDTNYQGDDIGLLSDTDNDGIDDGLTKLYNAGIRAFHIDSRLSIKAELNSDSFGNTYDSDDMNSLVLVCAGTETDNSTGGQITSIRMTVEDALVSLGKLVSTTENQDEFIEVILTVSDKPKTRNTLLSGTKVYGTVDPTMMLTAISEVLSKENVSKYIYPNQITPNTTIKDVLGKIVLKVNINATDAKIQELKSSGPMLISEGSMALTQYDDNTDIMLGKFNSENTVPMYWSNIYKKANEEGYMLFHYHQCQNTETSVTVDQRQSAIWEILKTAKDNYNADSHNALYQLGLGGWTDDNEEGKADIASKLSPFVNGIIEAMLNGSSYSFKDDSVDKMYPTPVGAVLMNFALKDQIVIDGGWFGSNKTYTFNSSDLIANIIELNGKCPMSRDENQPAWPTQTSPAGAPASNAAYAIVGDDAF